MKATAQYAKSVQSYKWSHGRRFGVFIVNFEHISHIFLLFQLLILNKQMPAEYPAITMQLALVFFDKVILLKFRSVSNI